MASPLWFEKGDKVEVLSVSKGKWVAGTIEAVVFQETIENGISLSPGSLKVSTESGWKWIQPGSVQMYVKKIEQPAPVEPMPMVTVHAPVQMPVVTMLPEQLNLLKNNKPAKKKPTGGRNSCLEGCFHCGNLFKHRVLKKREWNQ